MLMMCCFLLNLPANAATKEIPHFCKPILEAWGVTDEKELMELMNLKGTRNFTERYLEPATKDGYIELTQPDSPNSPTQKYRLTAKGRKAVLK